jgi:hypothetical protein
MTSLRVYRRHLILALAPFITIACSVQKRARVTDSASGAALATARLAGAGPDTVNWSDVDTAMGRANVVQGDVHRYNFPRGDLHVTASGVALKPAFALGGWVAMKAVSEGVVAMGDLVLTEDELTPVLTRLQNGGIEQTAIHHHVIRESPRIFYMHVHARGHPVPLAQTLRAAVALTKAPAPTTPPPAGELGIDTAQIAKALGHSGRVNGGVYQVSVPRAETVRDAGIEVPPSMGLATAINFQPTGGGKAAIIGDFVMIASEVNPVIRALRENGIEATSLHSHLLMEEPRLFFMHFWANDDAVKLARGLRAALDKTNSQKPQP